MGSWIFDSNPGGVAGIVSRFVMLNGVLYALPYYPGSHPGVARYSGGAWSIVFGGTDGPAALWNEQLFCVLNGTQIYSSINGTAWGLEIDLTALQPALNVIEAIGGGSGSLYVAGIAATTCYFRRTTAGVWSTALANTTSGLIRDITSSGSTSVYRSEASGTYRWNGATWSLMNSAVDSSYFTWHGSFLYAASGDTIYRLYGTNWVSEYQSPLWSSGEAISLGGDGKLYKAYDTGAGMEIRVRNNGSWILHSSQAAIDAAVASTDADGVPFLCTRNDTYFFYKYDWSHVALPENLGLRQLAMSVDGDGDFLYVGIYDANGYPILVGKDLPMTTDPGLAMFQPGAGDAINVRTLSRGDSLVISGHFGNNEQVEASTDGGATFSDIDPGTWGNDRAQPLLVDPDTVDGVMVALDSAQDIIETADAATWTTRNAAVGYSPGAMAKLPDGDELVVGDDAANEIDYSPNRGQTLVDITGAFGGNVAALEIV